MIPAKKIVLLTTISIVILIIITYNLGGEYLLMTGKLSEGHEILSKDCGTCHTPLKSDFKKCISCHQEVKEISLHSKGAIQCTHCHMGHNTKFKQLDAMTCLSKGCHGKMMKISDHSGDPKICFNCHPEHPFEKKVLDIKTSDLIFSHRIHTDKSNFKAYYPCGSCHQISLDKIKMGLPVALIQCKECHSKWVENHDVKKPITEKECAKCHYSQKKEIKGLGKGYLLKHARFDHKYHFNLECETCHFQMSIFNELEDISILSLEHKHALCAQCHFNPFIKAAN